MEALGLPLHQAEGADFVFSEKLGGSKYFGVWPLSEAAKACFGTDRGLQSVPVPQVSIEFDVADAALVAPAAEELKQKG